MTSSSLPTAEQEPFDIQQVAEEFVEELTGTLRDVLGGAVQPFELDFTEQNGEHRAAARTPKTGVPLSVGGRQILRLTVMYHLAHDSRRIYLKTEKSSVIVYPFGSATPLFHYDYNHDAGGKSPAAHINVHAHRDEALYALYLSDRGRGKRRQRDADRGTAAKLADIHFPVGGHRFRPCLEDVLEMLVLEFGIDKEPRWRDAVTRGRERWRRNQLKAAIWDDPAAARAALAEFDQSGRPEALNKSRVHAL